MRQRKRETEKKRDRVLKETITEREGEGRRDAKRERYKENVAKLTCRAG